MRSFVRDFLALLLLASMSGVAASHDRSDSVRHCLSIADVNERIECLETGSIPDSGILATPNQAARTRTLPDFERRLARTSTGRTMHADATMSEWDARMGQALQQAVRRSKDNPSLLDDQRLWLAERDKRCRTLAESTFAACLLKMTKQRVTALSKAPTIVAEAATAVSPCPAPPISTSTVGRAPTTIESSTPKTELAASRTAQSDSSARISPQEENSAIGLLFAAVGLSAVALSILIVALRVFRKIRRRRQLAAAQKLFEQQRDAEWRRLVGKYGAEIAARIVAHKVWQGMTVEQLIKSWGCPADVNCEIVKTRKKETWKYVPTGKNRFANRIYLENGIVIGWKI
jgi:uncharacterized protein YecT (DUF1311 family)